MHELRCYSQRSWYKLLFCEIIINGFMNDKQLKMMALGGNKNLGEFFQIYDLIDESVQSRYKTRASEFYRQKVYMNDIMTYLQLRAQVEGQQFNDDNKPNYDQGREAYTELPRANEMMSNNPTLGVQNLSLDDN